VISAILSVSPKTIRFGCLDPDQGKMKYHASSLVLKAIAITHKKNVKCMAGRALLTTQVPLGNLEIRRICINFVKLLMWYQQKSDDSLHVLNVLFNACGMGRAGLSHCNCSKTTASL
jgi:hypothetical protein